MKKKNYIIGLIILIFVYLLAKMKKRTSTNLASNFLDTPNVDENGNALYPNQVIRQANPVQSLAKKVNNCKEPRFANGDFSGRNCSGSVINENKVLRLGDNSCEVLLLQQRLNNIERLNILEPSGQFCCKTKQKLMRVMSKVEIALIQFSPDEQIGFNELEGGKKITPYSYMDVNYIKKQ